MKIAIDFDGTIVKHMFPEIGSEVPHAIPYLQRFQDYGATLILWTMRSDTYGEKSRERYHDRKFQKEAIDFCASKGLIFSSVNHDPDQKDWSNSPKCYAHLYIDDAALGCPLILPEDGTRPYVDWLVVGPLVLKKLRNPVTEIIKNKPIIKD